MISIGYITKTDGTIATVASFQNEIFDDVLLVYPYGFQSKVKPSNSTLVLLLGALNSKTNLFAIPYDVLTQSSLNEGECELKNRVSNNGFKAGASQNDISGDTNCDKSFNATISYKVNNIKVVGIQQPTIAPPTGGINIDVEARASISNIITALKSHGLIAP